MKILHIFEVLKDRLYAAEYDDNKQNILDILQEQWTDPVFLELFFEVHKSDLQSGFFGAISIEQAIEDTMEEADELFDVLYDADEDHLDQLFKSLDNREYKVIDFQKRKAKGAAKKSWLRIYAVSCNDAYFITGGAIKLTKEMKERENTKNELDKLELMRILLRANTGEHLFVYLNI